MKRYGLVFHSIFYCLAAFWFGVCPARGQVVYPEKEVRVRDLPMVTAQSSHAAEVLAASLEVVIHDRQVCCGKDSALQDSLEAADPKSLKDVAEKLQGRHLLSDGRAIVVTAEFLTLDRVNAGNLIAKIIDQNAPLMAWDSHVYVVGGITFAEIVNYVDGVSSETRAVQKFLLQDVRYSDARRAVTFDRAKDDAGKVQGLLFVQVERK